MHPQGAAVARQVSVHLPFFDSYENTGRSVINVAAVNSLRLFSFRGAVALRSFYTVSE